MRTRIFTRLYLSVACSAAIAAWPQVTFGACTINPTAGDDTYTCDSGNAAGFTDNGGNNTLNMSGTGTITGNATLGAGIDIVTFLDANSTAMRIDGSLNQGDGNNIFQMNNGTITGALTQGAGADIVQISGGTIGAVSQGAGVDSFAMSGGTIASLQQGNGYDTFVLNAGTITGAFEDGDHATMTGGSIGRVDMKLDDNFFYMHGGTIFLNLVTGFGKDTIEVSNGYIGGNISVSGGVDFITITGGTINGELRFGQENDHFEWNSGGQINSFVLMGPDNDTALLKNLTEAIVASTPLLDGGVGVDTLTLDNTRVSTPERYVNWETVNLDNNSQLTLGGTFTLGDSETGTGTLNINDSSALLVGTGVISPLTAGQLATVNNGGLIDMTTASSIATDSLTINGNYTGNGGQLALQTVLGADDSPSDKLVVNGGAIQGNTRLMVSNQGGAGAATLKDGIPVVQAINGATSTGTAFTLGGPVSAGAYDYYLYRGGTSAGTEHSFFLRSTIPVTPLPEPEGPVTPLPEPGPGTPPLPPNPGDKEIPIYRPEVPVHSAALSVTHQLVRPMLGTFHERAGEQEEQRQTGALSAAWGRVYGNSSRQGFAGTVSQTLDSSLSGYQVGSDIFAFTDDSGLTQRFGFFVGHSRIKSNVKGFNSGWEDKEAGKTTVRGDSGGAYWIMISPRLAYLDVVVTGTRLNGHDESDRGVKMKVRGHNFTASAEVGWPFPVATNWVVEPQAQLIVGKTKLDSQNDGISDVSFNADTSLTSRLGVRLRGTHNVRGMPFEPYLRTNVWHTDAGTDRVTYNDVTHIDTEQKSTTADISVGAMLKIATDVSLYGEVGYERNLDSNMLNGRQGTLGLRMAF